MNHVVFALVLLAAACKDSTDDANPFASESGGVTRLSEAGRHLHRLGKNAKRVFAKSGAFPTGTAKTMPVAPTDHYGAGGCCGGKSAGSTDNKCPVAQDWASDPVWKALDFHIDEPTGYRYSYVATDGKSFTATATADLDCDGREASYTLTVKLDEHGKPTTTVTKPAKGEY